MNLRRHILVGVLTTVLFLVLLAGLGYKYLINKPSQSILNQSGVLLSHYIDEQITDCYNQSVEDLVLRQNCFQLLATKLGNMANFKEILDAFDRGDSLNSCHDVMHYVVNNEYERGTSLPDIYAQCTSACFGACYHGGLEGYFKNHNLVGANKETIERAMITVCNSVNDKRSQCYHGLGHALMLINDGDLPQSLLFCDALSDMGGNHECYAGAFMENLPNNTSGHPARFLKESDPLYPCNILDQKYLKTCYQFQVSYFTYLAKGDWSRVATYCLDVPSVYRNLCYQRIGSGAPGTTSDVNKLKDICNSVPLGLPYEYCIRGVVDSFLDRYSEDRVKLLGMLDFCPTVPNHSMGNCYDQVGEILLGTLGNQSELHEEACSSISDDKFRALCLGLN